MLILISERFLTRLNCDKIFNAENSCTRKIDSRFAAKETKYFSTNLYFTLCILFLITKERLFLVFRFAKSFCDETRDLLLEYRANGRPTDNSDRI